MTAGGWADMVAEWAAASGRPLDAWQEEVVRRAGAAMAEGRVHLGRPRPAPRTRAEDVHAALEVAAGGPWTIRHLGHGLVVAEDAAGQTLVSVDPARPPEDDRS